MFLLRDLTQRDRIRVLDAHGFADPESGHILAGVGTRTHLAVKAGLVGTRDDAPIRDARGRHDCIYIFLNSDPLVPPQALDHLSMMLPFIDAAVRKVEHLPSQNFGDAAPQEAEAVAAPDSIPASEFQLSSRELEIMGWVRMGKTNHEVGRILNISTYTVKNHLQRIFRKLNVTNRAQAVADPSILDSHREGADRAGLLRDLPQSYRA